MRFVTVSVLVCLSLIEGSRLGIVLEPKAHRPDDWRKGCAVMWSNGQFGQYPVGCEGQVAVVAVQTSLGGYYYPSHLACVGQEINNGMP
jgi:hypothetical protein